MPRRIKRWGWIDNGLCCLSLANFFNSVIIFLNPSTYSSTVQYEIVAYNILGESIGPLPPPPRWIDNTPYILLLLSLLCY